MTVAVRVLAALVGVALLGLVVDAAVTAAGGYGMPAARLMIGLAAGIAAGSLAVGLAWEHGRRRLALCLVAALVAGEAWTLLQTAERTIAHRDQQQAPARAAADARTKAAKRVKAAEAVLAGITETPRLKKAETAKAAADAAVIAKASDKGCAVNCRQLLQKAVDDAAAEVTAARAEIATMKAGADGKLQQARADLAALPPLPSASPLADRLGVSGWSLDLLHAALASLAANGLAAFLLAFAAHGWRRQAAPVIDITPVPVTEVPAEPAAEAEAVAARDAAAEADHFARSTLRPAEKGRVRLAEVPGAYRAWCAERGLDPLPDGVIGPALAALFASVGLHRHGTGVKAVVRGIEWRSPPLLTTPAAKLEPVDA
jgi:hypothetical protein